MMSVKTALAGGGALLAAIAFLAGNLTGDIADPIEPGKAPILVAPASGIFGFEVGPFCNDPATKVVSLPAPDVAGGVTWQLTRLRDGRFETVVIPGSLEAGTHYFDFAIGQQSEPATVDNSARDCITKKAGR